MVEIMRRIAAFILVGLFLLAGAAASASAERLESYDEVIRDATADARNYVVGGVAEAPETIDLVVTSTGVSRGKQDISTVEMGTEPDTLHVVMNLTAHYGGTSSILFVVHFKVDGEPYFTCWNVNSAGTTATYQDIQENSELGCSKFNLGGESTRVGATTRENGIDVELGGPFFVRWEVPRSAIGDPADGTTITDIVAETWNRGFNPDHLPNTEPQSAYVWNMADRAPDEGVAEYVLGGGAAAVALNLTASPSEQTVGAGSVVPIALNTTLVGAGEANVTYSVGGLPDGWEARFSPEVASLNSTANQTASSLQILVDPAAENGTYAFTVIASAPLANASASANVTITIDRSLDASGPPSEEPSAEAVPTPDGNGTTPENGTALEEAGGLLPAPGFLIGALLVGAVAAATRQRRKRFCQTVTPKP